jgi:hypothetical protein
MTLSGSWSPPLSPHENIHSLGKRRAPAAHPKKNRLRTPAVHEVSFFPSRTPPVLASYAGAHVSCGPELSGAWTQVGIRHCLRIEDLRVGGVERERECPDVVRRCVHRRGAFDRDVRVRH